MPSLVEFCLGIMGEKIKMFKVYSNFNDDGQPSTKWAKVFFIFNFVKLLCVYQNGCELIHAVYKLVSVLRSQYDTLL